MGFYELSKEEREVLVAQINKDILLNLKSHKQNKISHYFSDEDTYIRKTAYIAVGRIYSAQEELRDGIITTLESLLEAEEFKVRQTVINTAGEIGKKNFNVVKHFFDTGLFDEHHSVRNAVIGSVKKMGEVNPKPVLTWAKKYLHHTDKEIRREICHGIELRGRKHPQDILPLLKELQFDKTSRVRSTLVHVLGQIAYKKGCLEIVITDLNHWDNKDLVLAALVEIIDVHDRYKDFSYYTQAEAKAYIKSNREQ